MVSFLSVIADLAAHHGKQLDNEMPTSFTVNAKRSGSEGPRHREPPASSAGGTCGALFGPRVAYRAPEQSAWGDWTAHGVFFSER